MTTTITGSGGPHIPTLFLVYATTRKAGTVIEELLDSTLSTQLRAAGSRRGRFEALFSSKAAALSLEVDLSLAQVLALTDTDVTAFNMNFVCSDAIVLELDTRTRSHWLVKWDFREVP